jgi:membrane protein YqaA with SNARE-associated domain
MAAFTLKYLVNFIGLFLSMVLFFAPFVAVFAWRNRASIKGANPHFNYFMERFFMSREADALVFAWAAAEAVVWYIIPEFLLFLLIFMKVHRKFDLVKYDILGTIVGSIVALSWHLPQKTFLELPYIRPRMLTQVDTWYRHHGIFGLLYQPFSGVPYKVFTHEASTFHFFIPAFILLAIAARMVRYVVAYEATKALYPLVHRYVRKHYGVLFVVAIAVFTFLLLHVVAIYHS